MINGLVSAIIPVFNRPWQLPEAVESVLAQDYAQLEVLIVDDGSTDETLQVARGLAQRNGGRVRVFSQRNGGPGMARQHGLTQAGGEFIQYLDSDDVLLPGKFAAQVRALRASPDCGVAYGMTRYRHADGRLHPDPWKGSGIRRDTLFPSLLLDRWWDTPNPLYRRSVCNAAGPWTDLRLEEDWEYDCRVAALGTRLAWCAQYVCEVRDHAGARLCRGAALDAARLRQRARSHELILGHARRVIAGDHPAMRHFTRALFLLARQCGAAGLRDDSRRLLGLALEAARGSAVSDLDMRLYAAFSSLMGWRIAGVASQWLDRVRSGVRT